MNEIVKKLLFRFKTNDQKSKELIKNIALSFGVKGLAIVVSLINIPIFMDYFKDSAVLGIWFTLLAMLTWILTFDLGIGNGLRNYLVVALEAKDDVECKHLVSSSYCSITVFITAISIVAFFYIPKADWISICNIDENIISQSVLVLAIRFLFIGVMVQFLLKIITSILYAMQKPAIPNFLVLISNVLLLLSTFVLKTEDAEINLIRLSAAYILTANIPLVCATVYVFLKPLRKIGIHPSFWTLSHTKLVIGLGFDFLVIQLFSMACFNTREFYIMRFLSPEQVVPYQVYNRLYFLISTFFVLAMTPMWSAITQAAAQGDKGWIKKTYRNTKGLFLLFALGSLLIILLSQFLVDIWLGNKSIEMSPLYGLVFTLFNIEYMWINLHSQFENGLKRLKAQKIGYLIAALLIPVLSFLLTKMINEWIVITVANGISLLPLCIMQYLYMKEYFSKTLIMEDV